jgi:thiol-disulfide isomerase/thioredoxin
MVKNQGVWMILGIVVVMIVIAVFAFSGNSDESVIRNQQSESGSGSSGGSLDVSSGSNGEANWLETELRDINSGEMFKISDFKGKPILVESFAVWCPTCTRQQKEIKELHEEVGDDVISISLDTDPNEDESKVRSHAQSNGFDWRYVISPVEVTRALIDEFGSSIVNAPSVPMILICEDLSFRKLGNGVKDVDELKSEIAQGC